jgi:hypothetical protein
LPSGSGAFHNRENFPHHAPLLRTPPCRGAVLRRERSPLHGRSQRQLRPADGAVLTNNLVTFDTFGTGQAIAFARALPGTVGARSFATVNNPARSPSEGVFPQAGATAKSQTSGLVFSGPGGSANTALNLTLTGGSLQSWVLESSNFASGWNSVSLRARIQSADTATTYLDASGSFEQRYFAFNPTLNVTADGLLASFSGTGPFTITTPTFLAPQNTPLLFTIELSTYANISGYNGINGTLEAAYGNSLTLLVGGPVFSGLGGGISADAPEFNLISNNFTPVPEPSQLALLAGLAALVTLALRRRRA